MLIQAHVMKLCQIWIYVFNKWRYYQPRFVLNVEDNDVYHMSITCMNLTWVSTKPVSVLLKCFNKSCTGMPFLHSSARVLEVPYTIGNLIHDNKWKPPNERNIKNERQLYISAIWVFTPNKSTNALYNHFLVGVSLWNCKYALQTWNNFGWCYCRVLFAASWWIWIVFHVSVDVIPCWQLQ